MTTPMIIFAAALGVGFYAACEIDYWLATRKWKKGKTDEADQS